MTANNAKPTPGPWRMDTFAMTVVGPDDRGIFNADVRSELEMEANAALIAEAGNVYHETGLTPRQLADQVAIAQLAFNRLTEQRAELLAALDSIMNHAADFALDDAEACNSIHVIARAAIAKFDAEQVARSGTTHSEECWRWHHDCAVAKLERAEQGKAAEPKCEWYGVSQGQHQYVDVAGGKRCIKCKHEIRAPAVAAATTGDAVMALLKFWRREMASDTELRCADKLEAAISADKASGEVGR